MPSAYELVKGDLHRHGTLRLVHPSTPGHLPILALAVIAIAAGAPILDPIIDLGMTAVILRITRESWRTVRGHPHRNCGRSAVTLDVRDTSDFLHERS